LIQHSVKVHIKRFKDSTMALVNGIACGEAVDDKSIKRGAKHDITGVQDLEKVTDYAEEKELSQQDISGAMSRIGNIRPKESDNIAKQQALAKVSIKKEDIELIIKEMEVTKAQAELKLREHDGNVVQALISLTN